MDTAMIAILTPFAWLAERTGAGQGTLIFALTLALLALIIYTARTPDSNQPRLDTIHPTWYSK